MQSNEHDFHGLLHSADLIEADLRRRLAPLGVQPRQARILKAMSRMGLVSQKDLASAFGITSASMSTMTDRLLSAGYITRAVDPSSRRQHVLDLTDKGRVLLAGIAEVWTAVDDAIRGVLGNDSPVFFNLARQLRDGMGGVIPNTKSS